MPLLFTGSSKTYRIHLVDDKIASCPLFGDDLVFTIPATAMNKRLKKIGQSLFGDKVTLGRKAGKDLTMYDFRHSSACYWLSRYKSRNAILYRFGWKKEEELHYYTELLGMRDTISEEDMLVDITKTDLEKELGRTKRELEQLRSQVGAMGTHLKRRERLDPILTQLMNNPKVKEILRNSVFAQTSR